MNPNWLDRAIAYVAPAWGAQRQLARVAHGQALRMGGYREAIPSRLDRPLYNRGTSADYALELGFDRRELVDRARQLERDNLLAGSLLDRSTEHVIGDGFMLQCKSGDEVWNTEVEALWEDWCLKGADSRGISTFPEILAMVYRSWLRDGDVACVLEADGCLRLVESDEIASPHGGHFRPGDADGVELDRRGRPVAYHIFDYDSDVLWPDRRQALDRLTRVPASDCIFIARRSRANQTRGLTAFQGIFWILEQLDGTIEAVTVAHRMAACFGLVVTKKASLAGASSLMGSDGRALPSLTLEPGKILRLEPEEGVSPIAPPGAAAAFEPHFKNLVRLCGTRFCLAIEQVMLDATQANYSNLRGISLETQKATRIKQTKMGRFCSDVFLWKLLSFIREGKIRARPDGWKHHWRKPGSSWIDPVAEVQAAQAAIDSGLETRTKVLARMGHDFEDVARELEMERRVMKKLGAPDIRSTLTRDAIPTTATIAPPGQEKPATKAVD